MRPRRNGPAVVIADATWEAGGRLDRAAMRTGLRLVDHERLTYAVLSDAERVVFPLIWGVDQARVAVARWPYILSEPELEPAEEGSGIFAGGDSLRDYGTLVDAARGLAAEVTIATRNTELLERHDLPSNVRVEAMPHERYVARLRESPIIVVPLVATTRSAGQTTYVNALAMGKLVVVTDTLGVRDYVEPGETGLVVPPGEAAALHEALAWAVDPANTEEVTRIRARARQVAQERFRPDDYVANLLRIAAAARERIASRQ
jgi:glycosyltransferase involved in cell wall biosynthesis